MVELQSGQEGQQGWGRFEGGGENEYKMITGPQSPAFCYADCPTKEAYTKPVEKTPNKEDSLTFKYMGPAEVLLTMKIDFVAIGGGSRMAGTEIII